MIDEDCERDGECEVDNFIPDTFRWNDPTPRHHYGRGEGDRDRDREREREYLSSSSRYRSGSLESIDIHTKRHRAGSISGRLRTASDLEECGLIDKTQKGVLKDKIITGDPILQQALDKYDQGDFSRLEAIIKTGGLSREDPVDLLDGLDLDFLNFGKGGVFQNLDEADFSFDDLSGFRLRGMSEMGLPPDATAQHSTESRGSISEQRGGGHLSSFKSHQNHHGIPTRDHRSGSMNWFETSTFLNDRESDSYLKNYSPNDISLSNHAHLDEKISSHHQSSREGSFDSTLSTYSTGDITGSNDEKNPQGKSPTRYLSLSSGVDPNLGLVSNENLTSMGYSLGTLPIGHMGGLDPRPAAMSALASTEFPKREYGKGYIGIYSAESRKERIERFFEKRKKRVWTKKVKYDVRKNFADSRLRVKGRFVKKEDEELLRDLLTF